MTSSTVLTESVNNEHSRGTGRELVSPNQEEVRFLNQTTKKSEYMHHIEANLSLNEDSIIVDVGANVGAFSAQIAEYIGGATARIFAIEPFTGTFACLKQNTAAFDTVKCHKAAIGSVDDKRTGTYLPGYTLLSGFHVDGTDKKQLEQIAGRSLDEEFKGVEETVDCFRLDTFLSKEEVNGKIDLVKIDVEKSELDVLKSLGCRINDVNAIAAEVHEEHLREFMEILVARYGQEHVFLSEKDLPTFALSDEVPSEWPESLNTYIAFAYDKNAQ